VEKKSGSKSMDIAKAFMRDSESLLHLLRNASADARLGGVHQEDRFVEVRLELAVLPKQKPSCIPILMKCRSEPFNVGRLF